MISPFEKDLMLGLGPTYLTSFMYLGAPTFDMQMHARLCYFLYTFLIMLR